MVVLAGIKIFVNRNDKLERVNKQQQFIANDASWVLMDEFDAVGCSLDDKQNK